MSVEQLLLVASQLECSVHYTASIIDLCIVRVHISISNITDAVIKGKKMIDHRDIL